MTPVRVFKACPAWMILFVTLFILPVISIAQSGEILKFEPGDTLEEIRSKIAHNGYHFTVDNNRVFDMPPDRKERFLSRRPPIFPERDLVLEGAGPLARHLGRKLPSQLDWRDHNGHAYIGPVKDQGGCGSCYAFGACAAAEGAYNKVVGKYDGECADFSESFIIWCLGRLPPYSYHLYFCDGADYDYFEIKALTKEGICREEDFPYTEDDPGSCTHWDDPRVVFKSWHRIPCNDIEAIKTAIMTYGVVDAAVLVVDAFEAYSGDIYEDTNTICYSSPCYYTDTNHIVALVGWNDNGDPENEGYWILRNSWGPGWGEGGYMRIKYRAAVVACEVIFAVYEGSNQSPTADTGPDQSVDEGVIVTLDGSNSSDPNDNIASYRWTQTAGQAVTLSDTTAVQPTFMAPDDVGSNGKSLTFRLTVTDKGGLESQDTCIVNVTGTNKPPKADAGPDQSVGEGATVTLDGSGSSDTDDGIASYLWSRTAGPPISLSDKTAVQPTFTVMDDVDSNGECRIFRLTVTDQGGLQSQDTCIVNVTGTNQPPTADAGPDQSVTEGATVTLDGSGSSDTDDGITSYLWSQTAGPSITLSDPLAVRPTFFTPSVGESGTEQTFQLTVTDEGDLKKTDEVSVKIEDNDITGFPDGVVTATSSTGKIIGIKAEDGGSITYFSMVDPDTIEDAENRPINLIYGLIDMRVRVHTFGGTATVTVYLPDSATLEYTWFKYSANRGWADCSDYTVFNDNRTRVTIHLVDGGQGDADGVANGIIIDPSGLGFLVNEADFSSDGCFITHVTRP